MPAQTRNFFLIALAVILVAGLALIFGTRGTSQSPAAGGGGAEKKFTVSVKGQSTEIVGKPFSGNAVSNVRYSLGPEDAKMTVVLFSDYQCPYCRIFTEETEGQFISEFVDSGKVRFIFRDMPLQQHQNAPKAAAATACANEQGKYWQLHNVIFRGQAEWSELPVDAAINRFVDYASQVGVDTDQLKACIASGKYDEAIRKDAQDALALGLDGTPSFFINGYRYSGAMPIEALRAILKDAGIE